MKLNILENIKKNLFLLSFDGKFKLYVIMISMIVTSFAETIGLSMVIPFVALLVNPKFLHQNYYMNKLYSFLGLHNFVVFVAIVTLALVVFFILKNFIVFLTLKMRVKYMFDKYYVLSKILFNHYLRMPYSLFIEKDTPTLLRNAIGLPLDFVTGYMLPLFIVFAEAIMLFSIMVFLLWFDFSATLFIGTMLGITIVIYNAAVKKRLHTNGILLQECRVQMNKQVIQSLNSIKETKVLQKEGYFYSMYKKYLNKTSAYTAYSIFVSQTPRLFIETVAVSVVLGTMVFLLFMGNKPAVIVIKMSIFGMAAIRMLPALTKLVGSTTLARSNYAVVDLMLKDLKESLAMKLDEKEVNIDKVAIAPFNQCIDFKNVTFKYKNKEALVLRGINLKILKGQSIGIVGRSGSGKTTLVDLLLGILKPISGEILVDGKNIETNLVGWRKQVAYVPQKVYILNETIKQNIAFGVREKDIDENKIWNVLQLAQLREFVEGLPNKLHEKVGEDGMCLSGGQCQRIGIARALYHDPSLLVLDEATAALDNITESQIINSIYNIGKEKTIIMIAHRLSTVKNCDVLFYLENGQVVDYGTYQELCEYNAEFKTLATI